ncbi:MAG: arsenate reductase [Gammaproteobacteria bacterium]|nr:arsenate reductase [Gammaproteobacteria bacterium]
MILYGIPNCDTVRKARKYLTEQGVDYTFHDFRKEPLAITTLEQWLKRQPIEVIVNKRSTGWKQLTEVQKEQLMQGKQLNLLSEIPTLIKRPVLDSDSHLIFGFKEAEYQALS